MKELGYKIVGRGNEPVIIMHEWLGDHSNYDPILPYLNKKDYKWIFTDLRGYGLSIDLQGSYTCREAAEDIISLSNYLDLKSFHLVGHSMSAMVAQRIAADIPEIIKTLVLVTPVPASGVNLTPAEEESIQKGILDDAATMAAINARTGNRYNSTWLKAKLSLARRASTVEARAKYLEMFLHTDFAQEVAGLEIPVRVITGKFDIPVFQEEHIQQLFSRWYPNLEIKKCRESGHYPMLECPVFFASMLEYFISNR